jgi:hypothetical protein
VSHEEGPEVAQTHARESYARDGSDEEEERSAIIEHDGGIPRSWAEGFARLHPDRPPGDVPLGRWQTFCNDVGRFLDSWASKAASLGWTPLELFGADRDGPFARVDCAGLLWLVHGRRLVALSQDTAVIETSTGSRLTYRRKPIPPGDVVLAWELTTSTGEKA